ncbi:MAG: ammonium transporter [Chloroflexota bacterium]
MTGLDRLDDIFWIIVAATMVMFMHGGFTLLGSGLIRQKNSVNVAIKNLVGFCFSIVLFWCFGFGLIFGQSAGGWIGITGFFGNMPLTPWILTFFLFQAVFAGLTATIISIALAERVRFSGFLVIAFIITAIIYPVVAHWVWGGSLDESPSGWLAKIGFVDFAGATVVHSVSGWFALAAVLNVGPRIGRFGQDSISFEGWNLPLAAAGTIILWFGWIGFHGGSLFGVTSAIPSMVVNTVLAGMFGGLVALVLSALFLPKPDVQSVIKGILAGMVAVSAAAHGFTVPMAVFAGSIGSLLCFWAAYLLNIWKIDDVIGAFPVHGVAGVWGTLAVALIGNPEVWGTGLTRGEQFMVQLTGVGATFTWAFGLGYLGLWLLNQLIPLRVTAREEMIGLNVAEHGSITELQETGLLRNI